MGDDKVSKAEGADGTTNVGFGEELPTGCPPRDAVDKELAPVFRLVAVNPPNAASFASHQAQGKPKPLDPHLTECEWASCSLNWSVDELKQLKRLRKRLPFVAELSIPAGKGLHTSGRNHIHFWRYAAVDLAALVVNVEAI